MNKYEELSFRSEGHKERFIEVINRIDKIYNGKLDEEYAAALYLLTANPGTWSKIQSYPAHTGIDFEAILEDVDLSGGESVLVKWAANLFGQSQHHCDPLELLRLDEKNFETAITALRLRRHSLHIDDLK